MYLVVRLRNSLFAKIVDKPFRQIRNTVTYQCIVLRGLLVLCRTEKKETSHPMGKKIFFKSTLFWLNRRGKDSLLTCHVEGISTGFYMFSLDVTGPTVHLLTVVLWYTRILEHWDCPIQIVSVMLYRSGYLSEDCRGSFIPRDACCGSNKVICYTSYADGSWCPDRSLRCW